VEVKLRFGGDKPLEENDSSSGNSDNLPQAVPDYGTPDWHTWNASHFINLPNHSY
jgi:hypothetical protein